MTIPAYEIITSAMGHRMRQAVTEGFYDRSRIGLWLFEVMGREYDAFGEWMEMLRREAFPQMASDWGLDVWELIYGLQNSGLPFEFNGTAPFDDPFLFNGWLVPEHLDPESFDPNDPLWAAFIDQLRRRRVLERRARRGPINPAYIEQRLSELLEFAPVRITENICAYVFRVDVSEPERFQWTICPQLSAQFAQEQPPLAMTALNHPPAVRTLREIKPSHLSFEYWSRFNAGLTARDYYAGVDRTVLHLHFIEEHPIETQTHSWHAGVSYDTITLFDIGGTNT